MKKLVALGLLGCLGVAQALSIEVGGGPQVEHYRGWIQYKGNTVDIKKDLHLKDRTKYFLYLNLKHHAKLLFIPLPDVKFEYIRVNSDGTGTVNRTFTIGGVSFTVNDRVYTKFRFHQYDTLFYYTPLKLKVAKASWGFGVKVIDFYEKVTSLTTGKSESKSATVPLPYLYLGLKAKVPYLHASVEGKGIRAGGNYFYEWLAKAGVDYTFKKRFTVSLDGGYRYQRYRVDDVSDVSADVRMKGPFAALSLKVSF